MTFENLNILQSALLKEQLELEIKTLSDGRKRFRVKPFEEELSFDKGFFVFIRAIQMLTSSNDGTILVGLAGPSGSGKTAFSEKVRSFMPGVCVISMDNYNDGSKVVDSNFDDPRLTDYELLMQNIEDIRNGKSIEAPIYDFKQSRRVGFRTLEVPSSRVVIIEGIYALNEKLRDLLDLRVSITGGIHFDLVKRVLRDLNRNGHKADTIIQQISDTVYPMYKAFIEPDLKTAHLKIHNNFNPFSGFICNPIYILKSAKEVSSDAIMSVLDSKLVEKTDIEMVDIYLLPPNEDPEQCSSWLRMRSRDGRYSLMFEEWVTEVPFVISPRISFEVSVRILGGLMALGYEIGPILKRHTIIYSDKTLSIKQDTVEKLGKFVQIQGDSREKVAEAGRKLGFEGHYIPRSYIEQVQLADLVAALKSGDLTEHLSRVVFNSALSTQQINEISMTKNEDNHHSTTILPSKHQYSLPARLGWTNPIDIPHKNEGFQNKYRSQSDHAISSKSLLHAELQQKTNQKSTNMSNSCQEDRSASSSSPHHKINDTTALVESIHNLAESVRTHTLNGRVNERPWMWASIGCVCFFAGVLTGWMLK